MQYSILLRTIGDPLVDLPIGTVDEAIDSVSTVHWGVVCITQLLSLTASTAARHIPYPENIEKCNKLQSASSSGQDWHN